MQIYNSATRKKEDFIPREAGKVSMYTCGPTVYHFAHIGNLRSYIMEDILEKYLRFTGLDVKRVMNITDVGHLTSDGDTGDDKMLKGAKREKKTVMEIAKFYTDAFFADCAKLNIKTPDVVEPATGCIDDFIRVISSLIEKGYAYEAGGNIYFDTGKLDKYYIFNDFKEEDLAVGVREGVEEDSNKRNKADFVLWFTKSKFDDQELKWDSPWGVGYPGWHIECSAMSRKYLGDIFDIHTGGVDHIPIHHENEIAQSEGLTGVNPAKFWIHGDFMLVDGGKMSKSLGNTYTIEQLEQKGYSAMAFRYFCLNAHYRKKLNFTFETMDGAKTSYERMLNLLKKHKESPAKTDATVLEKYKQEFKADVGDDLNIPSALGVLWTMLKEPYSVDIYNLALDFDRVFGLSLDKIEVEEKEDIPAEIIAKAEEMQSARKEKNWPVADAIRAELNELGYVVKNTKEGYEITKK